MQKPKITNTKRYLQRRFVPKVPDKYVGDQSNIIARSSWELRLMKMFDENPSILQWSSETVIVPYVSPIDQKPHRYFVDFIILYKTKTGEIKRALIEVKPERQTKKPEKTENRKRMITEMATYAVNIAKWEAAKKWAENHGMDFLIFTEKELGIK